MKQSNSYKYRYDIDGLRAIAVIPVVIFHAFPTYFTGGYIGVDIFFVISGYLISSIIISNVKNNTFSFFDFYSKRIRRIYPALLIVIISCLIFGYFSLFDKEYKELAKNVAGSSVFISNFILLSEAGYFDTASVTKPLLHLWSLSIEEQFYIIWPLAIYISFKLRINTLIMILLFFVISFMFNIYEIRIDRSADFYLPFTRFWELNAGSILAVICLDYDSRITALKEKLKSKLFFLDFLGGKANLCSILGTLILIYGYFTFNENISFPGFYAFIPVLGTFLLILSGQDALVNKYILSTKPLIWIGIISYPIYLWHWPLLSFSYIVNSGFQPEIVRIGLIALTVLLSWMTYFFIERKFRYGKNGIQKTVILFFTMIVIGTIGLYIYAHNGLQNRFKKDILEIKDKQELEIKYENSKKNCNKIFPEWLKYTDNACAMQNPSGENNVAIIGDSHANQLFIGLTEVRHGGVAVFPASCALPFVNTASALKDPNGFKVRKNSYKLINSAYSYVINDKKIREVILAHHPDCSYNDAIDMTNVNIKNSSEVIENGMRRSLALLVSSGKKVVIVKDNSLLPYIPEACGLRPLVFGNVKTKCSFDKKFYQDDQAVKVYNSIVDKVVKDYPMVSVVDLSKILCDESKCYLYKNGHVIYLDMSHLNEYGSRFVAPYIK